MATYLNARRHINRVIGATILIHSCWQPNDDGPGASEGHERINGSREVWSYLVREEHPEYRLTPDQLLKMKTLADVRDALRDVFEGSEWVIKSKVETLEQFEARKSEERRRGLEAKAGEIARRYNCSVDSLEFLTACTSELNHFADYREGMREDGLCIGYGVTFDQWNEEYACSLGDSDQINEIIEWLASECPLLYAKHQESKLRGDDDLAQ